MAIEYELFYLVGETKEAEMPQIREEVEKIVTTEGGVFLPVETTEKRKLAYEIKKEIRGTYIARRFTLPDHDEKEYAAEEGHPLTKINRALMLHKGVLRFLVLRADELPELKPIAREERKTVDKRLGRGERQRSARPITPAPQTPVKTEEAKEVSAKEIDDKLKDVLDI